MTDPTSYAAGIEAAARVADRWGMYASEFARPAQSIAKNIRALAPERGGDDQARQIARRLSALGCSTKMGTREAEDMMAREIADALSPAPPAAPSGYRLVPVEPTEQMISATVSVDDIPQVVSRGLASEVWKDMLAAAPPPPVPAQAESGEVRDLEFLAACQKSAIGKETGNSLALKGAADRIRELEGEVANLKRLHNEAESDLEECWRERDRLTTAAQAAREALEPFAAFIEKTDPFWDDNRRISTLNYDFDKLKLGLFRRAREALASLASVLDGGEG